MLSKTFLLLAPETCQEVALIRVVRRNSSPTHYLLLVTGNHFIIHVDAADIGMVLSSTDSRSLLAMDALHLGGVTVPRTLELTTALLGLV